MTKVESNSPHEPPKPNLIVFIRHQLAQRPRLNPLGQPRHCPHQIHDRQRRVVDLVVVVEVAILLEEAKRLAIRDVANRIQREERGLLEELHGTVVGGRGAVFGF